MENNAKMPTFKSKSKTLSITWYKTKTKTLQFQGADADDFKTYVKYLVKKYVEGRPSSVAKSVEKKSKSKSSKKSVVDRRSMSQYIFEEKIDKIWSAIESVRNSPTSLNKQISKDQVIERKESQKPNCLFLYKTSKTDTAANKQRSPHPIEQDEAKETATWQREEVSYKQKIKEQEDTIKAIFKENHELLNSNKELKKKVDELTKINKGNSKTEEKIKSSSSKIEEKKEDVKVDGKPTIVIAGDSIVKDVKGWIVGTNA